MKFMMFLERQSDRELGGDFKLEARNARGLRFL